MVSALNNDVRDTNTFKKCLQEMMQSYSNASRTQQYKSHSNRQTMARSWISEPGQYLVLKFPCSYIGVLLLYIALKTEAKTIVLKAPPQALMTGSNVLTF